MIDIKKIQRCVLASMAVEGAVPSEEGKKITEKYLKGKITSEEAIKLIMKKYMINYKNHSNR